MTASRTTPLMAARTNTDWSNNCRTCSSGVSPARILGRVLLTLFTTASVDALPLRITVSRAPRRAVGADDAGLHRVTVAHLRHIPR
jgi:hypothetical protein